MRNDMSMDTIMFVTSSGFQDSRYRKSTPITPAIMRDILDKPCVHTLPLSTSRGHSCSLIKWQKCSLTVKVGLVYSV